MFHNCYRNCNLHINVSIVNIVKMIKTEPIKIQIFNMIYFVFSRGWGPLLQRTACRSSVSGQVCGCCFSQAQLESANSSSFVASPASRDHDKQLNNVNNKNNSHKNSHKDVSENNSNTAIRMTEMGD